MNLLYVNVVFRYEIKVLVDLLPETSVVLHVDPTFQGPSILLLVSFHHFFELLSMLVLINFIKILDKVSFEDSFFEALHLLEVFHILVVLSPQAIVVLLEVARRLVLVHEVPHLSDFGVSQDIQVVLAEQLVHLLLVLVLSELLGWIITP